MDISYGKYLDPDRSLRQAFGVKGIKKTYFQTISPSTVSEGHSFTINIPSLSENEVIVPGSVKLCGDVELTSADANKRVVDNFGRNRFRSVVVRISGEEVLNLQDANILLSWMDLWKSERELEQMIGQGVVLDDDRGQNLNCLKIRCDSEDKDESKLGDLALSKVHKNNFTTPLDFEILSTSGPFYQAGLKGRLQFDLLYNNNSELIVATDKESKIKEKNLALEFVVTNNSSLANDVKGRYMSGHRVLYDRIVRLEQRNLKDSDTLWNFEVNVTCKSLKGLLFLWKNDEGFGRKTDDFVNPSIKNITLQIKGQPNMLFPQGMKSKHFYEQAYNHFVDMKKGQETGKQYGLTNMSPKKYHETGFGLWVDFRSVHDNLIHGSGMRFDKVGDLIAVRMEKAKGTNGNLRCFVYAFMDAVLHFSNGSFSNIEY